MPALPRRAERTLALTVKNTGFLLDRMGEDCHTLQFLRELTQNSIEAIRQTPHGRGEIIWDVDWVQYDLEGVYKLCLIDTGVGMTSDQLIDYINQLSSSGSEQSFAGNYGVGAKVAAATRNHDGLIYFSWKDGDGAMIHLWRDPTDGTYGLRQIERPDGSFGHVAHVEDDVKPEEIESHGTKVVLMGNADDDNTMEAPAGAASPSRWIAKYLNSRYFRFPEGVTVKAREGWANDRTDKDRNVLRMLTGQGPYLDTHSLASGRLALSGATAHWWVLKDEDALSQNSGFIESTGHVAALYQDELYELVTGRSGMARLQQFGVILGHRRVVIYVEPEPEPGQRLTTDTARTRLLLNQEPLPWADWATEFQAVMPDEIKALIDEVAAAQHQQDHSQSIRDRLGSILDMFRVSRYRPNPKGTHLTDPTSTSGGASRERGGTRRSGTGRSGGRGGAAGGVYSLFLKKGGTPADKVKPDPFPEVLWISVEDGTRDPDDLADRAARYIVEGNRLLINGDFRVFTDMVARWEKELRGRKSKVPRALVEDTVRAWFEQALVETVIGVQALRNEREWSLDQIAQAYSEEALTAAVMQRYHLNNAIKRELGSKIGKIA